MPEKVSGVMLMNGATFSRTKLLCEVVYLLQAGAQFRFGLGQIGADLAKCAPIFRRMAGETDIGDQCSDQLLGRAAKKSLRPASIPDLSVISQEATAAMSSSFDPPNLPIQSSALKPERGCLGSRTLTSRLRHLRCSRPSARLHSRDRAQPGCPASSMRWEW